jgi:hypothetical protein
LSNLLKNIIAGVFIILLFVVGYFRETVFLVINSVINKTPFPYNTSYITPPSFLYHYTDKSLIIIKWVLTVGFSFLFMAITLGFIHFYFRTKKYNHFTIIIYMVLITISGLVSISGIIFNNFDEVYTLSRFLIGLVQSPLIPLALFVLFYFKSTTEEKNPQQ